jgi:hypothetical protein
LKNNILKVSSFSNDFLFNAQNLYEVFGSQAISVFSSIKEISMNSQKFASLEIPGQVGASSIYTLYFIFMFEILFFY